MNYSDNNISDFITYLLVDRKYSDNTIASYKEDLCLLCEYLNKDPLSITYNDVLKYLEYLNKNHVKTKSVARKISAFTKLLFSYTFPLLSITIHPTS